MGSERVATQTLQTTGIEDKIDLLLLPHVGIDKNPQVDISVGDFSSVRNVYEPAPNVPKVLTCSFLPHDHWFSSESSHGHITWIIVKVDEECILGYVIEVMESLSHE